MSDADVMTPASGEEQPDRPEIVERPAAQPPAVQERSALEHAAEELMSTPGAPGRDEFLVLATTARILSMSQGAPKAVRGNPWLAFHLALIGRDLGISPSAAIAQVDVIGEGENAQLSLSPELLNGQIRRMGLGSIVKASSSAESCTAVALLPGGRLDYRCAGIWPDHVEDSTPGGACRCTLDLVLGDVTFTWEDARQAGLVHRDCVGATEHTTVCLTGKDEKGQYKGALRCHQGYRTYPKRMMWWRAASWCQSDYFPEAGIGMYTAEELGAVVDPETGRPVDPGSVELPDGYAAPEAPHDPSMDLLAEAEDGSDLAEERTKLRARIDAVAAAGEGAKDALRELWEQTDDDGNRRTPPFGHLRRRHLVRAKAIVKAVEDRIKRGEWEEAAREAWQAASTSTAEAPGSPSPAPEPADAPDTTDAPTEHAEPVHAPGPRLSERETAITFAVKAMDDERVAFVLDSFGKDVETIPVEQRRGVLIAVMLADDDGGVSLDPQPES